MRLKSLRQNRKGQTGLNLLVPAFITLGIAFVIGSAMALVLSEFQKSLTAGSDEAAVVGNGSKALLKLASFGTIFGIIIAVAVILALIAVAVTAFRPGTS